MDDNVNYSMDGDSWMATRDDFIDLVQSQAGFGKTQELALANLRDREQGVA